MSPWFEYIKKTVIQHPKFSLGALCIAIFTLLVSLLGLQTALCLLVFGFLLFGSYQAYLNKGWGWDAALLNLCHKLKQKLNDFHFYSTYLKKAQSSRLPWHLVIGMQGDEKKVLIQSLVQKDSKTIPLMVMDGLTYQSVFSDKVVLIDIPSECLQASFPRLLWKKILTAIKRKTRKSAIQSIILVINCKDFENLEDGLGNLRDTRSHIDALYHHLGVKLPIQLIVTGCANLPGYALLTQYLYDHGLEHAIGTHLNAQQPIAIQLKTQLNQIVQYFEAMMIRCLHHSFSEREKAQLAQLPQALSTHMLSLIQCLQRFTEESVYEEAPCLRGVWFHGFNTEENVIDFSVRCLSSNIVSSEKPKILYTQKQSIKNHYYKQAFLFGLFLTLFGGAVFVGKAYITNNNTFNDVRKLLSKPHDLKQKMSSEPVEPSQWIELSRVILDLRHFKSHHPWFYRLGMGQAQSLLTPLEKRYAGVIKQNIYFPTLSRLGKDLSLFNQRWPQMDTASREKIRGRYYSELKLYLMLLFPELIDSRFANPMLTRLWFQHEDQGQRENNPALEEHQLLARMFLEHLQAHSDALKHKRLSTQQIRQIANARRQLLTNSGIENLFASLHEQSDIAIRYEAYASLVEELEAIGWEVHQPQWRFYSRKSFANTVQQNLVELAKISARHDWVIHASLLELKKSSSSGIVALNNKQEEEKQLQKLYHLYFKNYLQVFQSGIATVNCPHGQTLEYSSQILSQLIDKKGMFYQLFRKFNENLSLHEMLDSANYESLPDSLRKSAHELEVATQEHLGSIPFLEKYLGQLDAVLQDIESLEISDSPFETSKRYLLQVHDKRESNNQLSRANRLVRKTVKKISATKSRKAMQTLLLRPIQLVYRSVAQTSVQGIQNQWQSEVVLPFHQKLANHFPFDRNGRDASLSFFGEFFRPNNGIFAQFFKKIQPLIVKKKSQYLSRRWLNEPLPLSKQLLQNINQIDQLSKALFPNGKDLALDYRIYPMPSPGVKEILFSSNGQSYPYRNGPQEWVSFSWPSFDQAETETFLRITEVSHDRQVVRNFDGPWGLFHLISSANKVKKTEKGYCLNWVFKQSGRHQSVQTLLGYQSSIDPFKALLLDPIHLSKRITG